VSSLKAIIARERSRTELVEAAMNLESAKNQTCVSVGDTTDNLATRPNAHHNYADEGLSSNANVNARQIYAPGTTCRRRLELNSHSGAFMRQTRTQSYKSMRKRSCALTLKAATSAALCFLRLLGNVMDAPRPVCAAESWVRARPDGAAGCTRRSPRCTDRLARASSTCSKGSPASTRLQLGCGLST
jgi:hypothetical protein